MILPDLLKGNLKLVFCGTAAGNKSAERKAYYAGEGNLFYPTLASCGFTPRILKSEEFPNLLDYGMGLTDLIKHHFGMDKDLKKEHCDTKSLERKILQYQPQLVCFKGKVVAKVCLNLKYTVQISYGLQDKIIGNSMLYLVPSKSLLAIYFWDESIWN